MLEKIWTRHVVATDAGGRDLLYVDRHLVHEGSFHAFEMLRHAGRRVRRPDLTVAVADHYVPTAAPGRAVPEIEGRVTELERNAREWGLALLGPGDPRQGIVHVIGPEQGLTLPGLTLVCGDSHTATHGAIGALAFGIGASEVEHVLATQTIWQRRPRAMRVWVDGRARAGVSARRTSCFTSSPPSAPAGAPATRWSTRARRSRALSMEARMTLCNMAIEAGSRTAWWRPTRRRSRISPAGRWPRGATLWARALDEWRGLASDPTRASIARSSSTPPPSPRS